MKTNNFSAFAATLLLLLVTACNKTQDPDPDPTPDPIPDPIAQRLVKSLTFIDEEASVMTFHYDNKNRISKIQYEDDLSECSYADNRVVVKTTSDRHTSSNTYTLNNLGYQVYCITDDGFTSQSAYQDGYLSSIKGNNFAWTYVWTKGKLTSVTENKTTATISYGDIVNNPNCNIDFTYVDVCGVEAFWDYLSPFGYWGKRSSHLISTILVHQNNSPYVVNYKYTTDAQNFVTQIELIYTYSYEEEKETIKVEYY